MLLTMVTRFECDDAIAKSIIKLNEKGYGTRFCCSGHENQRTSPYISFTVSASLYLDRITHTYYALPTNWVRETHNNYNSSVIYRRFTEEEYLTMTDKELISKAMNELEEWVDILPCNAIGSKHQFL